MFQYLGKQCFAFLYELKQHNQINSALYLIKHHAIKLYERL
jgi:hypothetical protein